MPPLPRAVRTWLTEAWFRDVPEAEIVEALPFTGVPLASVSRFLKSLAHSPHAEEFGDLVTRIARLEWQGRVRIQSGRLDPLRRRVPRVKRLSHRAFIEQAYAPNRPIVVTDMMRDWKAVTRWTWPFLRRNVGTAEVQVMEARETTQQYDLNVERISQATTLGEFIGWIERVKRSNARYLVARNNGLTAPGLRSLLRDIGFFSGILNRRLLDGFVYLWVGPGGTVTPLHHDTANNLFCQVRGRKRFILVDPANAELLRDVISYYSFIDAERFDLRRFPYLADVDRMTITVGPGEALFIPSGWWHHVRSLSPSISVSMTNFTKLLDTDDPSYPVPGRR
ncbi:MAG: cupin-like domain-containing protein [Myxococcales bacterium]|nr:cupin-like domain-containing protein [Myxococcales bacterium]